MNRQRSRTSRVRTAGEALGWALVVTCCAAIANAEIGTGSLFVAGAANTPTHWNVPFGQIMAEIRGVSTSDVGDPLPPTIVVFVKSSAFGNVELKAFRISATNDYVFTYWPMSLETGCGTTVVAYTRLGLNANNDLLDDGEQNGSRKAAAGFRFVDANGELLDCPLGVEPSSWGLIKARYRS